MLPSMLSKPACQFFSAFLTKNSACKCLIISQCFYIIILRQTPFPKCQPMFLLYCCECGCKCCVSIRYCSFPGGLQRFWQIYLFFFFLPNKGGAYNICRLLLHICRLLLSYSNSIQFQILIIYLIHKLQQH